MNTAYNYKTGRNNITFDTRNSKKGTYKSDVCSKPACADFADRCMSFIDTVIELLSSSRAVIVAKAIFAFIALVGLLGIIGGIEFGTVSLFSGVICLGLIIVLEFLILKD